jgi:hypothetical protein
MKLAALALGLVVVLAVAGMLVFVYVIQNVEKPDYRVVVAEEPFELRDYPPMVVAEVIRSGDRRQGLSAGFGPLARYIFAKERAGPKIAMTAPVEQQQAPPDTDDRRIAMTAPVTQSQTSSGDWAVRFIMPSGLTLEDLPEPAATGVSLRSVPQRRMAAVRFSGRTTDAAVAEREGTLRTWIAERGLKPAGNAVYAYYNDPFTPGFLRRNEVLIEIAD